MTDIEPLRDFVIAATKIVDAMKDEGALIEALRPRLAGLAASNDWLPEEYARPHPEFYRQYLLHADPLERLSIVSFVWGPGQKTPIHDHRVWGLVGILRGAEVAVSYTKAADGKL